MVDNYGKDWTMMYMFTSESMSWCAWVSLSDFTVFEEFTVKKHAVNMSFNGDFSPHQDHYCICHGVISGVMFQVYFRELSHKTGLQGDMPDPSTERLFVCLCPTQVLLGPFLSPLTSLSVLRPVGAERLNVMTPFFLCALGGPSIPLTFTQLSLRSQGYRHQLWSPTPAQKTQRNTQTEESSANARTPITRW